MAMQGLSQTKPHTLRQILPQAVTVNQRLYILHHLCPKDSSLPKTSIKHPVKIMDFKTNKLHSVDYLNDDSTGTVNGEEKVYKKLSKHYIKLLFYRRRTA